MQFGTLEEMRAFGEADRKKCDDGVYEWDEFPTDLNLWIEDGMKDDDRF